VTAYALLTGFSPFGGDTDQETFCNISNADVDFPDELFEDVSAEAVDFIRKLLVKDPGERLTAKECLKHPWLANLRRSSSGGAAPHHQQAAAPPSKRSGCNTCATGGVGGPSGQTKRGGGLQQSYLSKSREALFERIVSKHTRQDDARRAAALHESQYASSRMCESHTSLVSRARHGTRTFSKSKEKLYGLKSLSRSQDVLDKCKSIKDLSEVDKMATVGSLLLSLTGVSTLPNSLCSSTANISVSQSHIPERPEDAEDAKENVSSNGDRGATVAAVTAAVTSSTAVPTTRSRSESPADSSASGASSVEHFYHSDEEPRYTSTTALRVDSPALLPSDGPSTFGRTGRARKKKHGIPRGTDATWALWNLKKQINARVYIYFFPLSELCTWQVFITRTHTHISHNTFPPCRRKLFAIIYKYRLRPACRLIYVLR